MSTQRQRPRASGGDWAFQGFGAELRLAKPSGPVRKNTCFSQWYNALQETRKGRKNARGRMTLQGQHRVGSPAHRRGMSSILRAVGPVPQGLTAGLCPTVQKTKLQVNPPQGTTGSTTKRSIQASPAPPAARRTRPLAQRGWATATIPRPCTNPGNEKHGRDLVRLQADGAQKPHGSHELRHCDMKGRCRCPSSHSRDRKREP